MESIKARPNARRKAAGNREINARVKSQLSPRVHLKIILNGGVDSTARPFYQFLTFGSTTLSLLAEDDSPAVLVDAGRSRNSGSGLGGATPAPLAASAASIFCCQMQVAALFYE